MEPQGKQFKGLTPEQKKSASVAQGGEYRVTQGHLASESLNPSTPSDRKKEIEGVMADNKRELKNFRNSGKSIKELDRRYKATGETVEASGGAIARIKAGKPARYNRGR
jgi:hypothetical protein